MHKCQAKTDEHHGYAEVKQRVNEKEVDDIGVENLDEGLRDC